MFLQALCNSYSICKVMKHKMYFVICDYSDVVLLNQVAIYL